MPKINVYLPDDLSDAVKRAGVPVSTVCQRALEEAVRRVDSVRAAITGGFDAADLARPQALTQRLRTALLSATAQARPERPATTGDLLVALLDEGANLAIQVLRAADVDLDRLRAAAAPADADEDADGAEDIDVTTGSTLSTAATAAVQSAVTEAIALGHNYVGCEHLLLGLAAEADGVAAAALRDAGLDHRTLRRDVTSALAGYVYLQSQTATPTGPAANAQAMIADAVRAQLTPILDRLTALESAR